MISPIKILFYCLTAFLIFFLVSKFSYKMSLLDFPNERKNHHKATAYTGGLALSLIYLFSIYLFDLKTEKLNLIFSIGFLIAIVGFMDDKYKLNVGGKLSLQLIPIIYLIILENFNLNHLGDYNYFKLQLNSISIPFTSLALIYLINSFNYFDGLDGSLGFVTISVLSILYFLLPDENIKLFIIVVAIPLLIFLLFNFSIFKLPKTFLGDSGSLLLGFIIGFTLILISNKEFVHPILLAWSIVVFVYEFLSINIIRLKMGVPIFQSGHDHLHHFLIEKSKSVFMTNFILSFVNIVFFTVGYLSFNYINSLTSLILFVILFIIFFSIRLKFYERKIYF